MAAGGTPGNVDLGPGRLYYAPLGTTEPVSCSAALPSAWIAIGYTEDGTAVETAITSEAIEVAEELDPIAYEQTKRTTKLTLSMAEATKKRLALALGAGAGYSDDSSTFEFPDAGSIVGIMLLWDSDETPTTNANKRWLFRKCTPSGTVSIARKKAPAKALIPVSFDCAKPSTAVKSIIVFPNASGQV
jgi:hypothetical protein